MVETLYNGMSLATGYYQGEVGFGDETIHDVNLWPKYSLLQT